MAIRQIKITPTITNRDEKALEKYLSEVSSMKGPMGLDEEFEAGMMSQSDNKEIAEEGRSRLISRNLRFVISVAKKYKNGNHAFSTSDLIQYGNEGLIRAASKFDPTRGFKFISYAVWWIRQRILQAIAEDGRTIRLPLNQNSNLNRMRDVEIYLQQVLGRDASLDEVTEEMVRRNVASDLLKRLGIEPLSPEFEMHMAIEYKKEMEKLKKTNFSHSQLKMASMRPTQLDSFYDETESGRIIDSFASESFEENENLQRVSDISILLDQHMSILTSREKDIIRMTYGINTIVPKSLDEIGIKFDLTRERVRQIKEKALKKMRADKRGIQYIKRSLAS